MWQICFFSNDTENPVGNSWGGGGWGSESGVLSEFLGLFGLQSPICAQTLPRLLWDCGAGPKTTVLNGLNLVPLQRVCPQTLCETLAQLRYLVSHYSAIADTISCDAPIAR